MAKDTKPVEPEAPVQGTASYDFYTNNGFREIYVFDHGETRQEFREECDINTIMARYEKTGSLPVNMNGMEPYYYDFASMPSDLLGIIGYLDEAEEAFMRLPAIVRKEFENDSVKFVDFACDPKNLDKMREWGLAAPVPVEPGVATPAEAAVAVAPPAKV